MEKKEKLLVETSVQIKKAFSTSEKMAQIRERLKDASALTSKYVWYEFQRTIVADCVWLHRMLVQQSTLVDAVRQIGEEARNRRAQRAWQILGNLLSGLEEDIGFTDRSLREQLLTILEDDIEDGLHKIFMLYIDGFVPDEIGCAMPEPVMTKEGIYEFNATCRREEALCRLPEFLQANEDLLRRMADAIRENPIDEGLKKILAALERIFLSLQIAKGQRNCWTIGDCIITLESPKGYTIFTTNLKHFNILCQAVDKACTGI